MGLKNTESKCPFRGVFKGKRPEVETNSETECGLKVYRLHPGGSMIRKADHKLAGDMYKEPDTANALKWCGPMIHANKCGYWAFPAIDMDITYKGGKDWDVREYRGYAATEQRVIEGNLRPEDKFRDVVRTRTAFSLSEPATLQIWTGCIFRTPPGWCLHVRNPINFPEAYNRPFHIQEGIIESDWMNYDIWFNLKFHRIGEKVELRRDMWPPMAQLVPVRRTSYDGDWDLDDKMLSIDDPDGLEVWQGWQDYNYRKWKEKNAKEPLTYHMTRKPTLTEMREQGLIP